MDWVSLLVGNVIGGGITLAVSTVFYMLAAKGLKKEADDLRRLNLMLIYLLDGGASEAPLEEVSLLRPKRKEKAQ